MKNSQKITYYLGAFNRTRRNWNFCNVKRGLFIYNLLIAPEGIEIKFTPALSFSEYTLLIAPEGIEMKMNYLIKLKWKQLLIAPEGIEI